MLRLQQKEGSLMQQTASATPSRQERRVRRTRAMILAGFIQLMQQKPVKDISVRELADLVDINRSTFYLHYTDIYDLLEQTENGLMDQFLPSSTRIMPTSPYRNFRTSWNSSLPFSPKISRSAVH